MKNINYGIDLGTTNSGIGRYENGKVHVIKNPVGFREVLPSVVSFYRGRTLIGDKAREQYLTNAGNVFSAFKRKMGTSDKYHVTSAEGVTELSAIDLSAHILRELRNYIRQENISSVVITVPASFDTIQANATKSAGYQAGFGEVVLLQEPIAACLAYANISHLNIEEEQNWLVYDFGGGTFDAALVYINQRELKVIDNRGNNFLGGVDIDHAFLKRIVVPKLAVLIGDTNLWDKLTAKETIYEKLWHYLVYIAEEAKKELSVSPSAWVEIDFPELNIFIEFEVSQNDFNRIVRPLYEESVQFIVDLLTANNITFKDVGRIILVGGTTYIPFIRESLRELSGTLVDDSIDPSTAVIAGASYFAGSHPQAIQYKMDDTRELNKQLNVKLSFESYTNDIEELIAFKTEQPFEGHYRIIRTDGGFDSGARPFDQTASEFVALLPKMKNAFKLTITGKSQQIVFESDEIIISQGLYSVSGQLLPDDICIELDSNEGGTYLETIFKRKSILPLNKTLYRTFSKSIIKDSEDKIIINVVEGKTGTIPGSNLSIGYIELSGKDIESDLIQGTDIEIHINMDESRGLDVEIFVPSTGQQINHSFHIARRELSVEKMLQDILEAEKIVGKEIAENNKKEAYELSAMFREIGDELEQLKHALRQVTNDYATEEKYRIDERKRKLLGKLDSLTRSRDIFIETRKYDTEKEKYLLQEKYANEVQKSAARHIFEKETGFLQSGDKHSIAQHKNDLKKLNEQISFQNVESYIYSFFKLAARPKEHFKNLENREMLIEIGRQAVDAKDIAQLGPIIGVLHHHLDDQYKKKESLADGHIQFTNNDGIFRTGLK